MKSFGVELIDADEESLDGVLRMEECCFPSDWQFDNAAEYYRDMLCDPENINLALKEGSTLIGYLLAVPYGKAQPWLREADPDLPTDNQRRFYIETVGVVPWMRARGGGSLLLHEACKEGVKRGGRFCAMHARIQNGFSEKVQRLFEGRIVTARRILQWPWAAGEAYEYLEWIC